MKRIVFAVDLSPVSLQLVPMVRDLAQQNKSEVYVLFVARAFEHYAGLGIPSPAVRTLEEDLIKYGREKLIDFVAENSEGQDWKMEVVSGYPGEKIIEFAVSVDADLIVMGTHGRKGLEKIVFGSVAEHVVRRSPIPVLTVNPYLRNKRNNKEN